MSPGFCRTDMTADITSTSSNSYSCYSGAMRIYQAAMHKEATSEIFNHRGRNSNYMTCGMDLPFDE